MRRRNDLDPSPALVRAVVIDRYGGPEVLRAAEVPLPGPGPGDLRVRVAAAAVNPGDLAIRSGRFRGFVRLPFVPGYDLAGVVEAVGAGVTGFAPGDPVFAMTPLARGGAHAEHALVAAEHAAPAPPGPPTELAALPLVGLTALQALRDRAGLRPGADLLVHGAAGGVGHVAVQIGRVLGARVTAVTSGRHLDVVSGLGAHEVVDREQREVTALGARFDVVLDAVAKLPFRRGRRLLRPGGTMVTLRPLADKLAPDLLAPLRGGRRLRALLVRPDGGDLRLLARWYAEGALRPVVAATYPLADVAAAHRALAGGRTAGKVVLVVRPDPPTATPAADGV